MKSNKKGFTIVELIIVVAIIAILAAVLIPVFSNVVKTAKTNADVQLVKNLNTVLAAEGAIEGNNETMFDAIADAKEAGYDVSRLTPTNADNDILWDQTCDRFVLHYVEDRYDVCGKDDDKPVPSGADIYKLWKIYETAPTDQTYSIYWNGAAGDVPATLTVGFDAGSVEGIASLNYERSGAAQTVIIRTNGGNLTVNAANDTVYHYGFGSVLTVTAIASASYDEYGVFSSATLASGHIHVMENGYIGTVTATGGTVTVDGSADKVSGVIATGAGYVADNNGTPMGDATKAGIAISNLAELKAFRDGVNNGSLKGVTARLVADIDISNEAWKPIGNRTYPYYGTFNGNGHTISGLTNKGYYVDDNDIFTTSSTKLTGAAYGFFGVVGVGENDVNISNLKLTNVNLEGIQNSMCGVLVGADMNAAKVGNKDYSGNITLTNIEVSGVKVSAADSVAAIMGKVNTKGALSITGCTTDIQVESNGRAAGLVAYVYDTLSSVNVTGNTIKKDVYAKTTFVDKIAGIAAIGKNYVYDDNTTTGMKAYFNNDEQEDCYTLAYTYENGVATSVTVTNDLSKVLYSNGSCCNVSKFYDGTILGTAEKSFDLETTSNITVYGGVIANNFNASYSTNSNGITQVDVQGSFIINNANIKRFLRVHMGKTTDECVINNGSFMKWSFTENTKGTITINGGSFFYNLNNGNTIYNKIPHTGDASTSDQVNVVGDYIVIRYTVGKVSELDDEHYTFMNDEYKNHPDWVVLDSIVFHATEGWSNNQKVVGNYTITRSGESGSYTYTAAAN